MSRIIDEQIVFVQKLIRSSDTSGNELELEFDFPQMIRFAAETIVLSICLNLLSSGVYDWAKARILGSKQLKDHRDKLNAVIADGNIELDKSYLDSNICKYRICEVLLRAGIPENKTEELATSVVKTMRESLPEKIIE